jgi:hypothetical protein
VTGHGGYFGPADAPRHRRRLLTPVRQARPGPRDRIESDEYRQGDTLPAADLAHEDNVSIRVTYSALAVLAANRYVSRPGAFTSYRVIWQVGT